MKDSQALYEDDTLDPQEEDLVYDELVLKVDPKQEPRRVDLFIMDRIEKATRSKVQAAIKDGHVVVNDEMIKPNYKVKPGDQIKIYWSRPRDYDRVIPEDIPIDIRYEDDDLLVIYKPAGMVTHPAIGHYSGTLVNALAFKFQNMPLLDKEHPDRPGLVHRIDKNTTGLMLIAKNDYAMQHLAKQFFHHTTYRRYNALVWGDLKDDEGTITGYIGRNQTHRKLRCIVENPADGKYAVTHYKVLRRFGYVTLVECRLETGRTHQIRVHFKHIGHTLFNDAEYGGDRILYGTIYSKYKHFIENCMDLLPHQALHAKAIGFVHPTTGEYMQFESELPDYFKKCLDKWESYTAGKISVF